MNVDRYRKFIAAAVGFVAVLISNGVLADDVATWVNAVIAGLTALGVYATPNAPDVHPR